MSKSHIQEAVKEKYGQAAVRVAAGGRSCCATSPILEGCCDAITSNLYHSAQAGQVPEEALRASLGCGNPTALAQLSPGEVVLDLGSGGGIDLLLSAWRVGPTGKAYGLDMTGEMLDLARENQRKAGIQNAEFLGRPPGDLRRRGERRRSGRNPQERGTVDRLHRGSAARSRDTTKIAQAGFERIGIEPTRVYDMNDARQFLTGQSLDVDVIAPQVAGKFMSAFIRAEKPKACCGPSCCGGSATHAPG